MDALNQETAFCQDNIKLNEHIISIPVISLKDNLPWLVCCSGISKDDVEYKLNEAKANSSFTSLTHSNAETKNGNSGVFRGFSVLQGSNESYSEFKKDHSQTRPTCFLFSGLGSQWLGMGKQMLNIPIFNETVKKCQTILNDKGIDLFHILCNEQPGLFSNILNSFVGVIVFQQNLALTHLTLYEEIALVDVFRSLEIEPDFIIGHSVGELTAAYADGSLTLEQTVQAAYYRGFVSAQTKLPQGAMALVRQGGNEMKKTLPKDVELACFNTQNSCVISGDARQVKMFCSNLRKNNIATIDIDWSRGIAFHSTFVKPAASKFYNYLKELIPDPKRRSSRWISSSVDRNAQNSSAAQFSSAEYHHNNFVGPVFLETAFKQIPLDSVVIEFSPHGILSGSFEKSDRVHITLCNKFAASSLVHFFTAIGKLYLVGIQPNLKELR